MAAEVALRARRPLADAGISDLPVELIGAGPCAGVYVSDGGSTARIELLSRAEVGDYHERRLIGIPLAPLVSRESSSATTSWSSAADPPVQVDASADQPHRQLDALALRDAVRVDRRQRQVGLDDLVVAERPSDGLVGRVELVVGAVEEDRLQRPLGADASRSEGHAA